MRIGCFLSTEDQTPAKLVEQALAQESGFDEIYVSNMSPHHRQMMAMYRDEVLPSLRG